jgi:uncharacterized protein (UPF0276 family)
MTEVAVNYSAATAGLYKAGLIQIDRYKCPDWPDLISSARRLLPVYVHFSLKAGLGKGDALETGTGQSPDWNKIEGVLAQTGTPLVNIHLSPTIADQSDNPVDTTTPAYIETLTEYLVKDVQAVVRRLGAERVVVENDHGRAGAHPRASSMPQVIGDVVKATGCGLLLDLAHARLAADQLGMDVRQYINSLPVKQVREVHVSGVQRVVGHWVDLFRGFDARLAERYAQELLDHLPMTGEDWELADWSMQQIREGNWGEPWVVAMECGGVSPVWELLTFEDVLREQVPRLYAAVKGMGRE